MYSEYDSWSDMDFPPLNEDSSDVLSLNSFLVYEPTSPSTDYLQTPTRIADHQCSLMPADMPLCSQQQSGDCLDPKSDCYGTAVTSPLAVFQATSRDAPPATSLDVDPQLVFLSSVQSSGACTHELTCMHSPVSDAGYMSQEESPLPHLGLLSPLSQQQPPSQQPADRTGDEQQYRILLQCLRDNTSVQRRSHRLPRFSLNMLYEEPAAPNAVQTTASPSYDQLGSLFDMALGEAERDKQVICGMLNISPDPTQWSNEEVRLWLTYMCQRFCLDDVHVKNVSHDGPGLCSMTEEDIGAYFTQGSDIIYDQLLIWLNSQDTAADKSSSASADLLSNTESLFDCLHGDDLSYLNEDGDNSVSARTNCSHVHLWQFLRELLTQPQNYGSYIRWIDQSTGVFKIEDSAQVAKLWGKRKNRPAMNYDKLSRSIRQYYKKGIMKKTARSQRLVYQFCQRVTSTC